MTTNQNRTDRWPTLGVVGLAFGVALVGFLVLLWGFTWLDTGDWRWLFRGVKVGAAPPRNAAALAAALAVAVAGSVAYTRQRTAEENLDLERNKADQGRIEALRARYTVAAAQLGDRESSAIRLAGVYAMAALADDWLVRERRAEAQTCVNVLCSYLRAARRLVVPTGPEEDEWFDRGELEVRQTIVSVVSSRLRPGSEQTWWGMDFDLTGWVIDAGRFDFAGVRITPDTSLSLRDARIEAGVMTFGGAQFEGTVYFSGVEVERGTLDLRRAQFTSGVLDLSGTRFEGGDVDFSDANFVGGVVSFSGARFDGSSTTFARARFDGSIVTFSGASFESGIAMFTGARFEGGNVHFRSTRFEGGTVHFFGAQFEGSKIEFVGAWIAGGAVLFANARLGAGTVDFTAARFKSGTVDFSETQFEGASVRFGAARFERGEVLGPWGGGPPPPLWPVQPDVSAEVTAPAASSDE